MSRFLRGRTMYDGRLSPPVRVFQPDLLDPTQQQIAVKYVTIPEQAPINRQSRRRPHFFISAPATLTTPQAPPGPPLTKLVRARPRPTRYSLGAPKVTGIPAPVLTPVLVKRQAAGAAQRRRTRSELSPSAVLTSPSLSPPLAVFSAAVRATEQRRRTRYGLGQPQAVDIVPFSGVITTTLEAVRATSARRRPHSGLGRPLVVTVIAEPARPLEVALTRARRPRPISRLAAPAVVQGQTFTVGRVALVRQTRGQPGYRLGAPKVINAAAVVLVPIETRLQAIQRLQQRRRLATRLAPPVVVDTSQIARPVEVALTHARRPRPVSRLEPPTVLQVFAAAKAALTRTRPRRTISRLGPLIFYPATSSIRVQLARIRPRPTTTAVYPPTVLQTFPGPTVYLAVKARIAETMLVRPTEEVLTDVVYPQATPITTRLVRTRPRPTAARLGAPTVLQTFAGPFVKFVTTKPRPTVAALDPPTVVRVPSVEQQQQTITTKLARIRPRPTTTILGAPTVVDRPPVGEVVTFVVNQRKSWGRRFADQGQQQRLVRETGSAVTSQLRDPFIGPRPPQIIDPLPNQKQQTITVALVAVRTRVEQQRHAPSSVLPPVVFQPPVKTALTVVLTDRVKRGFKSTLRPPRAVTVERVQDRVAVSLAARVKPSTQSSLPLVVFQPPVETTVRVQLAPARRPKPISRLQPPFFYPQTTAITTRFADVHARSARPATHNRLSPPVVVSLATFAAPRVAPVRNRPRPVQALLRPPAVLQTFQAGRPTLARVKPVSTQAVLRPPVAAVFAAAAPRVTLARHPRRPVHAVLRPPTVVTPIRPPVVTTLRIVLAAVAQRVARTRRLPYTRLFPPPPVKNVPGEGCLTDQPGAVACLDDVAGSDACLADTAGAAACLDDTGAADACLDDAAGAEACLEDE